MAVELRPSDREDPFGDIAGLSLFPHTLALASPVPQPQEQESFQNLLDSMAANGSKNTVEDACTISTSYSKNQHLYVETEDKDRITDLKGNKENPQGRRPALGRKRARFSLKPISRDSSANSGIYDIVEPQEYFTAVDQMQKAEEELKKCQSGAAADLAPHHPSPTVRNRRRGILGRTASYKHHLSDNADATITLKMLQEDIPGQGIPSPATVSAYTELHLETTEKGISPSMEPKSELFGDMRGQGIVTEKGSIDDVLEKLFSSFKDFNGDNGVKLLQEKLRAKSRTLGKITLPEPDGIQRSNPRILKSMTRKGLDGSQLSEQTPTITTRSPLAVIANLQRRISLKDPLSDPYAMPLSDDESCLGEAMGQKIPLSSADMNHVVTNNIPADDAFTPEIVRGKRTSFVEKIHLSAHDANRTINKKKPSEEDNVEHSPYMCINSVDSCGFSNLENNVAAGHDGPSAKELDTVVKELTPEFVTQNDMEVLASPPSMNSSNISKRINASASSFSGDATLQDEVNVTLEGETISHAKDSEEISRSRSSRKICQNINNSGNGGTSSSQRDTVLQEEVNVIVQGEAVSSAEVSSGSLVGDARNLSTNPEDDASPLREFLPENRPSTIVPEENNENRTLQETSDVSPVGVRKRKAPLNAKSKKKSTSNRQSNSRRQSLADAGLTWKSGVRRSTRIKTRPLQHWCGEKVLYGRVHNSMITVIGMRYAEREVDGKSPVLKVKSYVSDQYADLVSKVAK